MKTMSLVTKGVGIGEVKIIAEEAMYAVKRQQQNSKIETSNGGLISL